MKDTGRKWESLVEDTKAWVPVSLEKSRLLRVQLASVLQEDEPVEEEMVFEPSSRSQEVHPTGGRRVTGQTSTGVGEPRQVDSQDSQLLNDDGKASMCGKRDSTWRHDRQNQRTWSQRRDAE